MKTASILTVLLIVLFSVSIKAQESNAAQSLMSNDSKLTIGGYGQIDYNQDLAKDYRQNGTLDVHRMVLLFGYKFSSKTQFVTEIELEHVSEVFVEQAFLDHSLFPGLSFRAGLMLVPMGLTNLYHEPTSYLGVERPNLDAAIVPTTWREIGAGFTGQIQPISLKFELYVLNGFSSYNGSGILRGSDGFRKGRQKGAESLMSSPVFAGRVSYYGLSNLNLGFSSYAGKTQSSLFDDLDVTNELNYSIADSSRLGIGMFGLDARYSIHGIQSKAQLYVAQVSNSAAYNAFTGKDMGSQLFGYYVELGYDVLNGRETEYKLIPFIRYEVYDTHRKTEGGLQRNASFNRTEITSGINWYLAKGAVLKADFQLLGNESLSKYKTRVNFGLGVWF